MPQPSLRTDPILDDAFEDAGAQVYGGPDLEVDDLGFIIERCPRGDNGHLFMTECGVTHCVQCGEVA